MNENLVLGVDLGSSYIKGVIGSRNEEGKVSIKAVHTQKSKGIEKGLIVDTMALRECFFPFVRQLLNKAGLTKVVVKKFYVFNSYRKMKSVTTDVIRNFEEQEISQSLLDEMCEESLKNPTSNSYANLESILQAYIVNDSVPTLSVEGKYATSLKARYTLVIGNKEGENNLYKAISCGNKDVAENACSHFLSFASLGEVVLTKKERVKGALLLDFGGETTTLAFYSQMSLRSLSVFDFGGNDITRKLMEEFSFSREQAEQLKIKCGVKPRVGEIAMEISGVKTIVNLAQVSECINKIVDSQLSQIELFCQGNNIIPRTMRIVLVGGGAKCVGISEKIQTIFGKEVVGGYPTCLNENLSSLDKKECQKFLDYSKLCAILKSHDENCIEEMPEPTPQKKGKSRFSLDKLVDALDNATNNIWGK